MASKVDGQQLQDLVCPLCLDVFKNATILSCGHTFCRECLEAYDEQYHHDYIVCPVCRESTNLAQNRIAGLTPNFLARGIQDKLHVVAPSQSFCPLHKSTHNDIFCEECKEFICLNCFLERHKGHKIKKKEEIEGDLKEKRDSLILKNEMKKAKIEESLKNAEKQRIDTHCHFSKMEKEIKDEFAKRVTILQQKEESLLNVINSTRKEAENQFEVFIANIRQSIDDINNSITILREYTGKNVDSNAIKTQYLQCSELEKSLKRSIEDEPIVRLKQTAENTRFRPSDEKLLALGHIEVGVKETSNTAHQVNNAQSQDAGEINSNIHQVKTAPGAKRKESEPPTRKKVSMIPWFLRNKSLKIVRQVKAPNRIWCMAAHSQDAVVVGHGGSRPGSDRFSVSGEKTQYVKSEVGDVCDIAFLTGGRSVVSHHDDTLRVYSTDGHSTGMEYTCKKGIIYERLCVDQDDNIYAVNGNPEIYIFHASNPNPQIVIPTGDVKPTRICVTKTGVLITRSWDNGLDTLTVFDREGHVGSSITASDGDEYLCATVDIQDRVLVARVRVRSDVFRLTRYTLQGTTLIQQVTFNELKLLCAIKYYTWCYMASLEAKLTAFAHENHMYFIGHAE